MRNPGRGIGINISEHVLVMQSNTYGGELVDLKHSVYIANLY